MKLASRGGAVESAEAKLPLREWIRLPVIGLFTVLLLAVSTELTARWLYPASQINFDSCFVTGDLSGEAPVKSNGVCVERIAESKFPAEYRFNSRGDRADNLQPKQPGVYRIVMIGSSMAMGLFVPREMSFASLLPAELTERIGHKVELYNMATGGKFRGGAFPTRSSLPRVKDVVIADPDMILWVITPTDVKNADLDAPDLTSGFGTEGEKAGRWQRVWSELEAVSARLGSELHRRWDQTRTSVVLMHVLLSSESPDQYVDSYLKNADDAEFLRTKASGQWQHSLQAFRLEVAQIARQANEARVPLVAVLVPNRAQAAMISRGEWPHGYDPYEIGNVLRTMIESDGGRYIDILPDLRPMANPERYYFPVDGHLDPYGHAMIARLLADKLSSGAWPALRSKAALAQGR